MEVILKEDVNKLGHRGDVVKVADGLRAQLSAPRQARHRGRMPRTRRVVEKMKSSSVPQVGQRETEAEVLATQMSELSWYSSARVGEHDHLFGSVTSGDIAHQLEAKGFTIDRRRFARGAFEDDWVNTMSR